MKKEREISDSDSRIAKKTCILGRVWGIMVVCYKGGRFLDVNIRQDCTVDQPNVIKGVPAGTALTVTGVSEDNQWYEVDWEGQKGYVSAQYMTADQAAAPAAPAADQAAAQ